MRKIFKYTRPITNEIELPAGKLVHVEANFPQGTALTFWVEHTIDGKYGDDPEEFLGDPLLVSVVGTGFQVNESGAHFQTVRDGVFVWHVYVILKPQV